MSTTKSRRLNCAWAEAGETVNTSPQEQQGENCSRRNDVKDIDLAEESDEGCHDDQSSYNVPWNSHSELQRDKED